MPSSAARGHIAPCRLACHPTARAGAQVNARAAGGWQAQAVPVRFCPGFGTDAARAISAAGVSITASGQGVNGRRVACTSCAPAWPVRAFQRRGGYLARAGRSRPFCGLPAASARRGGVLGQARAAGGKECRRAAPARAPPRTGTKYQSSGRAKTQIRAPQAAVYSFRRSSLIYPLPHIYIRARPCGERAEISIKRGRFSGGNLRARASVAANSARFRRGRWGGIILAFGVFRSRLQPAYAPSVTSTARARDGKRQKSARFERAAAGRRRHIYTYLARGFLPYPP